MRYRRFAWDRCAGRAFMIGVVSYSDPLLAGTYIHLGPWVLTIRPRRRRVDGAA